MGKPAPCRLPACPPGNPRIMTEPLSLMPVLRFATKLREQLLCVAKESVPLPLTNWCELARVFSHLKHARARNWKVAMWHLQLRAACLFEALQKQLEECRTSMSESGCNWLASLSEIVSDLRALEDEFAGVAVDLKKRQFSVVTDDIELESVALGPFRITLELSDRSRESPRYFVEALEPNPSSEDHRAVHPHVHDHQLCEGDGKVAIRQALQQGRLFDFFVLLRQVLNTYNAGSAYSSLSDWEGRICDCCSRRTSDDESTSCERCQNHICFDCSSGCARCERYCCESCYITCHACEESVCSSCSTACDVCHVDYCEKCLTESTCSTCRKDQEPDADEHNSATNATSETVIGCPDAAVYALGVGEAPLPA